jgi:VanZ family protein
MGMVFALSHMSHPPLPAVLWALPDKVLHAGEYLILGYLCARAFRGDTRRRAVLGVLTAALFGLTDEFHQSFIPGRDANLWDWAADGVGSAVGVLLFCWIAARRSRSGATNGGAAESEGAPPGGPEKISGPPKASTKPGRS